MSKGFFNLPGLDLKWLNSHKKVEDESSKSPKKRVSKRSTKRVSKSPKSPKKRVSKRSTKRVSKSPKSPKKSRIDINISNISNISNIPNIKIDILKDININLLRRDIEKNESDEYSLEKLENDVLNTDFLKKAGKSQIETLTYKLQNYEKLSKINWGEDLTKPLKDVHDTIKKYLDNLRKSSVSELIEKKRNNFMNILYDKDNGLVTLKGKSRAPVRTYLVKLIYMFVNKPSFLFNGFMNFMLTGPAGSGKTKVASVIANILKNLGFLVTNNVIYATKQNLVSEYIGQSSIKTRKQLIEGFESVIFIDEAYTITPCKESDPGRVKVFSDEAIGELINFVDKFIGCYCLIVAGYKKEMYDCFLTFNEGLARRFPRTIDLLNYDSDDLYDIFEIFLSQSVDIDSILSSSQKKYIKNIINVINQHHLNIFNNQAGDMLNLSKTIGEDAILYEDKYNKEMIELSFRKFCASKNIAIDFN